MKKNHSGWAYNNFKTQFAEAEFCKRDFYLLRTIDWVSDSIKVDVQLNAMEGNLGAIRILDYGCGKGNTSFFLSELGFEVVGTDCDSEQIDLLSAKNPFENLSYVHTTEIPAGSFDYIICTHVLEHCEEPSLILQRLSALLRHGGMLFLSVPNGYSLKELPEIFIRVLRKRGLPLSRLSSIFKKRHADASFSIKQLSNMSPHLHNLSYWHICKLLRQVDLTVGKPFGLCLISGLIERWFPQWSISLLIRRYEMRIERSLPAWLCENLFFKVKK